LEVIDSQGNVTMIKIHLGLIVSDLPALSELLCKVYQRPAIAAKRILINGSIF